MSENTGITPDWRNTSTFTSDEWLIPAYLQCDAGGYAKLSPETQAQLDRIEAKLEAILELANPQENPT